MRVKITFRSGLLDECKKALEWHGLEKALWMVCHAAKYCDQVKLMPYDVTIPEESDYVSRSRGHYELKKEFITRMMKRAVDEQTHLIQCHIHPPGIDGFSLVDERYELELMRHLNSKISGMYHGSIVFSNLMESLDSWVYDAANDRLCPVEKVVSLGVDGLEVYVPHGFKQEARKRESAVLDRTKLALGSELVEKLSLLNFGVVGASGLGGTVVEFLARDHVGSIVICDKDRIEESNLNRMPWAKGCDVGKGKADFYADVARSIRVYATSHPTSFYDPSVQAAFSCVDIIFGCLDSGARLSVNRLACANLIPYFDLGAGFDGGTAFGQVYSVIPGRKVCLSCSGAFDSFLPEYMASGDREREIRQGYLPGEAGVVPLVMSLDSIIAGVGYRAMLRYLSGDGVPFRVHYSDNRLSVSECEDAGCMTCGWYCGKGDKVPLMVPRTEFVPPTKEVSDGSKTGVKGFGKGDRHHNQASGIG